MERGSRVFKGTYERGGFERGILLDNSNSEFIAFVKIYTFVKN